MFTIKEERLFGDNGRFKISQFDSERFAKEWKEIYGSDAPTTTCTIFVEDTHNLDDTAHGDIVFQEWCERIVSFEQIVSILRRRHPEAFTVLQLYLDGRLNLFQDRFGAGKYPAQPMVDEWIRVFYSAKPTMEMS